MGCCLDGEYHSDFAMVPFRGFFEEMLIVGHLLFIREGDAIDSLERVIPGVAKPVRSRVRDIRMSVEGNKPS
jgi:hypothetical protein